METISIKDGKNIFNSNREYYAWIIDNDLSGQRECTITVYKNERRKVITKVSVAVMDCSIIKMMVETLKATARLSNFKDNPLMLHGHNPKKLF